MVTREQNKTAQEILHGEFHTIRIVLRWRISENSQASGTHGVQSEGAGKAP